MRNLFLTLLLLLIILITILYIIGGNKDKNYAGSFREWCRAGTRLRAFKKKEDSTWDTKKLAKIFDSVDMEKTYGKPLEYVSVKTTSMDDFKTKYLYTNKPCMILDIPNDWVAMKEWNVENFNKRFGKCKFKVTGGRLKYEYYYHYMKTYKHRQDDEPIFIFDSTFADKGKKMREILKEYTVPKWFEEDLFDCLSEEERPNFRWLLISIRRCGTSLHVDPVATSAWNTMITGKKRWILFPPSTFFGNSGVIKPHIRGAEWFLKEYPKHKHKEHYDFIQNPGETVFLPSDWWHITVNLEDSIAITQNILTHNNFQNAREQVYSQLPKVYFKWIRLLNEKLDKDVKLRKQLGGKIREPRTLNTVKYDSDYYESDSDID